MTNNLFFENIWDFVGVSVFPTRWRIVSRVLTLVTQSGVIHVFCAGRWSASLFLLLFKCILATAQSDSGGMGPFQLSECSFCLMPIAEKNVVRRDPSSWSRVLYRLFMPELNRDEQSVNLSCGNIRFPEMSVSCTTITKCAQRGRLWGESFKSCSTGVSSGKLGAIKKHMYKCNCILLC